MKEKELEDKLEKNLEIIESGLSLIERQKRINTGVIDLFCKDRYGKYVIVEIKKKPNTMVIAQLAKYNMTLIKSGIPKKRLRTILVTQELPKTIKEMCEFFNFEIKNLHKKEKTEKNPKRGKHRRTLIVEFVGDYPKIRLFDFLIEGRFFDYTLTDMAEKAEVSWRTLHRIWPSFVKKKIVIITRTVGRAKLYKLNIENPAVIKLVELFDNLLEQNADKVAVKKEIAVEH